LKKERVTNFTMFFLPSRKKGMTKRKEEIVVCGGRTMGLL
jgi:hypothetical protein